MVTGGVGFYNRVVKYKRAAVPVGIGLYDYRRIGVAVLKIVTYVIDLIGAVCIGCVTPLVCLVVASLDCKEVVSLTVASCTVVRIVDVTYVYTLVKG